MNLLKTYFAILLLVAVASCADKKAEDTKELEKTVQEVEALNQDIEKSNEEISKELEELEEDLKKLDSITQ